MRIAHEESTRRKESTLRDIQRLLAGAVLLFTAANAQAQVYPHFFIGIDKQEKLTFGAYAGLPNPNLNRVTFLYGHTYPDNPANNHFHSIGAYSYTGPVDNPTVRSTNSNNRIPELFNRALGVPLLALKKKGNRYMSGLAGHGLYEGLDFASVHSLNGGDVGEQWLYDNMKARWGTSLTGLQLALELVSITPGLHVADARGNDILTSIGDTYLFGTGDDLAFRPTFWTDGSASGTYEATFRLHDLSGTYLEGGTFGFDFQVHAVPEPSTLAAMGIGASGLLAWAAIRRRRAVQGGR